MRELDLSNYQIRTDLVADIINKSSLENSEYEKVYYEDNIKVSNILLDEEGSKVINKRVGRYTTIYFDDISDSLNYNNLRRVFLKELNSYIKNNNFLLVVGLGNDKSTPDSLGPKVIDQIKATKHIYELTGSLEKGYKVVSKISPGVMGETGIETSDILKGIIDKTNPEMIIVIDALASDSIERVCKTIQITDAGINPGSGIGNNRKEINNDVYNIPVIAIGIPTVVDASTIVMDTINFIMKHFSYNLRGKSLSDKLISSNKVNYLKRNIIDLEDDEKKYLLGAFGGLSDFEKKALILDVLTPIGYNLMVTPKEIDFDILNLSKLLASGINLSLHNALNDKNT